MLRGGGGIYKRRKSLILNFEQINVHLLYTEWLRVRVSVGIECESLAHDGEVNGM